MHNTICLFLLIFSIKCAATMPATEALKEDTCKAVHIYPIVSDGVQYYDQKKVDALVRWAEELGAKFAVDFMVESNNTDQPLSLIARAKRNLKPGAPIVTLPPSLIITAELVSKDGGDCPFCNSEEIASVGPLFEDNSIMLWLMWHKSLGTVSPYFPFIDALPTNISLPYVWPEHDTKRLRMNLMCKQEHNLLFQQKVGRHFAKIARNLFFAAGLKHWGLHPTFLTASTAEWAFQIVKSKSFKDKYGKHILPILGGPSYFRHKWVESRKSSSYVTIARTNYDDAADGSADTNIITVGENAFWKGEEVFIQYGKIDSYDLVVNYAIVEPDNPYEEIQFCNTQWVPGEAAAASFWQIGAKKFEVVRAHTESYRLRKDDFPNIVFYMARLAKFDLNDISEFLYSYYHGLPGNIELELQTFASVRKALLKVARTSYWTEPDGNMFWRKSLLLRFQIVRHLALVDIADLVLSRWMDILFTNIGLVTTKVPFFVGTRAEIGSYGYPDPPKIPASWMKKKSEFWGKDFEEWIRKIRVTNATLIEQSIKSEMFGQLKQDISVKMGDLVVYPHPDDSTQIGIKNNKILRSL